MNLREYKLAFEASFSLLLDEEAAKIPESLQKLFAPAFAQIKKGGKRIRAWLVDLASQPDTKNKAPIKPSKLAMAVELLHGFALIHDDLMDGAAIRRGKASVHVSLGKSLNQKENLYDARSEVASQTILLGDFFLSMANELANEKPLNKKQKIAWDTLQKEVVWGQMLDISLKNNKHATEKEILKKMELKTASYSFIRPLEMGFYAKNEPVKTKSWIYDFGKAVGLGFQLQDDLLDVISDEKINGKVKMGDIIESQATLLLCWFYDLANDADLEILKGILGHEKASEAQKMKLEERFVDLGIINKAEKEISAYFNSAEQFLGQVQNENLKNGLLGLLQQLKNRKS